MAATPDGSNPIALRKRRGPTGPRWLLLAAIVVPLSLGFLGTRGLGEPDEGRYVAVAREMAASGDWLEPTLHGRPHLTKPPATYWLVAAGLAARDDDWGARAFLAVVSVLTALVVARLGATMLARREGRLAGLVYATMLMPFAAASLVTPDALLTLLLAAALARAFAIAAGGEGARPRRDAALFWVLLGGACLVKGPPALLAVAVVALFAATCRDAGARRRLRALAAPLPLAAFAAIGGWWYAAACLAHPGLLGHWVEVDLLGRTIGDAHARNSGWHQPLKLWLPAAIAGTLPWSLAWPALLRRGRDASGRARLARRFAWCWVLATFALFTLARSRGMLYVLPAFPAIALLTTLALLERARERGTTARTARRLLAGGAVAAVALLAVRAGVARVPSHRDGRAAAALVAPHSDPEPDALVVAGRPLHSLEHYLGRPVEWRPVGLRPRRAFPPVSAGEREISDLLERPGRLVIVASDEIVERIVHAATRAGRAAELHPTGIRRTIVVLGPRAGGSGRTGLSPPGRTSARSPRRGGPAGRPRAAS